MGGYGGVNGVIGNGVGDGASNGCTFGGATMIFVLRGAYCCIGKGDGGSGGGAGRTLGSATTGAGRGCGGSSLESGDLGVGAFFLDARMDLWNMLSDSVRVFVVDW